MIEKLSMRSLIVLTIALLMMASDVATAHVQEGGQSSPPPAEQSSPKPTAPTADKSKPCATTSSGSSAKTDCKTPTGKKKRKKEASSAPVTPATPDQGPKTTVVRQGSTAEPTTDISPGMSSAQATHITEITNQSLDAANENVKTISARTLDDTQKATLSQVKSFISQANDAKQDGDWQRAYTLANKAKMLSAELVGH